MASKNAPKVTMIETRVLVLPDKAADFYDEKGTLIIPDSAKESPPQGEVIAIGGSGESGRQSVVHKGSWNEGRV
jgi:co-chaperonin GroES (HSP10)